MTAAPSQQGGPDASWPHRRLYDRVQTTLHALPFRFRTALRIASISATDLFTLNTPLGAAIEASVVENLNLLRELWDPERQYEHYSFVRQTQVFPDVRLQTSAPGVSEDNRILMGIELKGWFLLSKEGEPSFRYKASPRVCAPQDLLVVFPWILDEVISGSPRLMRPFVEEARYAAEHRNYYWEVMRRSNGPSPKIKQSQVEAPYPNKGAKFNDEAENDSGRNFGRFARGGLMEEFISTLFEEPVSGIPAKYWQIFFKIFSEGVDENIVVDRLHRLRQNAEAEGLTQNGLDAFDKIYDGLSALLMR